MVYSFGVLFSGVIFELLNSSVSDFTLAFVWGGARAAGPLSFTNTAECGS